MVRLLPLLLLLLAGCGRAPPAPLEVPRDHPGLHNVLRVTDKLLSGSSPEGDEGFASLAQLGVKTVISVDGARPELDRARKHGLRYVHLPIGYDGVPRTQSVRLARAVRDLPGLVYLHCHHGKHRGPAAAIAVRLCLDGTCKAADAVAFLNSAGTAPHYKGLYASAEQFTALSDADLDAVSGDFPEVAEVTSLVKLMVEMDKRWEHLTLVQKAGWKAPAHHPDIDPPHEATLLWELYRESARVPEITEYPESFRRWLSEGERAAKALAESLSGKPIDSAIAMKAYQASAKACADCHAAHRDAPRR